MVIRIGRKLALRTGRVLYFLVLVLLIAVAILTAGASLKIPGNYKIFVVESGSMEPVIKTGSVVIVKPKSSYATGDILTFYDLSSPQKPNTHRVVSITSGYGTQEIVTKGDANANIDPTPVDSSRVVGAVNFQIPYIGFLVSFAKTLEGLILLIIIPSVIIVYSELVSIKNESLRLLVERRKRKLTVPEKIEEAVGEEIIAVEKAVEKEVGKILDKDNN